MNDAGRLRPLPHLSQTYVGLPNGLPLIPKPKRLLLIENEEESSRDTVLLGHYQQYQHQHGPHQNNNLSETRKLTTEAPSTKLNRDSVLSKNDSIRSLLFSTSFYDDKISQEQDQRLELWRNFESRQSHGGGVKAMDNISSESEVMSQSTINFSQDQAQEQIQDQGMDDVSDIVDDWVEMIDDEMGAKYYWNAVTGEASWIKPEWK